ncbi:MAG: radical SAM protein [Actinobacteria bacterium]|nr:radical SAM protein [Actinomycetota bacterium]
MKKLNCFFNLARIYKNYCLKLTNCDYYPIRIWIELSSRCNLKCRFCVNKDLPSNQKGNMDFNLYKKIIDEISGKVYDINLFHRGEPLLNKDMVPMITYASESGIKTRIHTNATLLDKELSRSIISAGLDLISFSFDGYTKEIYEKNRSGASFEESLTNIINFLKIKKQLKSKKPYTIIQVIQDWGKLSTSETIRQKNVFLKNFKNLPLNKLISRIPHNWGGLFKINGPINNRKKENKKVIPCTFPWYSLTIFYDGRVFLCPQDFEGKICLGDLYKNSVNEIFNGKIIKSMRETFKAGVIENKIPCRDCDRIGRKTFMKIPREYLGFFLRDHLRS